MTYQPNKPLPTDFLDVSQSDIQINFQVANTTMGVNHYPFNDSTAEIGKHKFVQMPNILANPSTDANEGRIYTKVDTVAQPDGTFDSQLFYTQNADLKEYQITRCIPGVSTLFGAFANNYNGVGTKFTGGWTFLPGGLLFQYGLYDAGVGGLAASGKIIFPVAFTTQTYVVSPVLICKAAGTTSTHTVSVTSGTVNLTDFSWNLDAATTAQTGIYWTAIGV